MRECKCDTVKIARAVNAGVFSEKCTSNVHYARFFSTAFRTLSFPHFPLARFQRPPPRGSVHRCPLTTRQQSHPMHRRHVMSRDTDITWPINALAGTCAVKMRQNDTKRPRICRILTCPEMLHLPYNRATYRVENSSLYTGLKMTYTDNWRYVALVVVLWRPALSASSSSSASATALRWEPVNVHV